MRHLRETLFLDEGEGVVTTTSRKDHGASEDGEDQSSDPNKLVVKLTTEGRYICHICEKTFKTVCFYYILHVLQEF